MTPERRRRRARIAAHASWAKTADRAARTAAGTKAFCDRFERQVDPDGVLPPEEMALSFEHLDLAMKIDPATRSIAGDAALTLTPSTAIATLQVDMVSSRIRTSEPTKSDFVCESLPSGVGFAA